MSSLKSLLETGTALAIPIEALFIAELEEIYRAMNIVQFQAGDCHTYTAATPQKVWEG